MMTPSYVYDIDTLKQRIDTIKQALPDIPLTYSVKANSFVLKPISTYVSHIEVCSPGELQICKRLNIAPETIIYSGVMKELSDIHDAISWGAGILTAESKRHYALISDVASELKKNVNVILRISSDNQFGMDSEDIYDILNMRSENKYVHIYGFHYYSGTQKKKETQIESDIDRIENIISTSKKQYGYEPELVEYGPGLAVEYFKENGEELDIELLNKIAPILLDFSKRVPLGIEMGRYIAASCGSFFTKVKDLKTNYGVNYAIMDGGIHHLKYYGQIMAMHSPIIIQETERNGDLKKYCLCGSLCTVADILVKDIELQELEIDDILEFKKCGAYSLTESSSLFLSRDMPAIYLQESGTRTLVRDFVDSSAINTAGFDKI